MSERYVDVADKTTLDEVKAVCNKTYNYLVEANPIFGFIEHQNTLAPGSRVEYIGANKNYTPLTVTKGGGYNLNSWDGFEWLEANKPWMVKSDGTPDYRLNENDYTKKEDGTASDVSNIDYDGGAFSWAKKIYRNEMMVGDKRIVRFCMTKIDGFEPDGFIDPDNNELEGGWIPMFYGSILNNKGTCIAGTQPDHDTSTSTEKSAIDAFGSRARFFGGAIVQVLIDLMIMFSRTSDLQGAYGNGNMSGYDSADTYKGVKENAVVGGGQFYGTSDGHSLNKAFHSIVIISYQQWMRDPYTICVNGKLKVSPDYKYSLTGEGYLDTGIDYSSVGDTSWHYPHRYRTVPGFGAVPDEPPYKGSTSLGGCDGFVVNAAIIAVALRFGNCGDGAIGGVRALSLNNTAAGANWALGWAIFLQPPVGVAA